MKKIFYLIVLLLMGCKSNYSVPLTAQNTFRIISIQKCVDAPFYIIIARNITCNESMDYYIISEDINTKQDGVTKMKVGTTCILNLSMIHPLPEELNPCDINVVVGYKYPGQPFSISPNSKYGCEIYTSKNIYGKYIDKKDVIQP